MMKTMAVFVCAMLLSSSIAHASGINIGVNAGAGLIAERASTEEEAFIQNGSTQKDNEDTQEAVSETEDGWKDFDFSALPLISGSGGDTQMDTDSEDNGEQTSFFVLIALIFVAADVLAYLVIKWFGKNKGNPQ